MKTELKKEKKEFDKVIKLKIKSKCHNKQCSVIF